MAVFRDFRGPAPAGQTRACQFGAAEIAQCAMSVKKQPRRSIAPPDSVG